jgi:hypothetical protein
MKLKLLAHLVGTAFAMLFASVSSFAQNLTAPDPVGAGFSPQRLARITPWYAATGRWSVLDFEKDKPVPVTTTSATEFRFDGGDHTRLAFVRDTTGKVSGVVLNPGPWEIRAAKVQ